MNGIYRMGLVWFHTKSRRARKWVNREPCEIHEREGRMNRIYRMPECPDLQCFHWRRVANVWEKLLNLLFHLLGKKGMNFATCEWISRHASLVPVVEDSLMVR